MDAAGVGIVAARGAGGGGTGATLVIVGAGLGGSCDKDGGFEGEPGLGGRDGCKGELPSPVEGRDAAKVDGVGSGRDARLSTLATSGVTTMVGGGFAAANLALASAAVLSSLFFRSAIFPSSNLIFFTKSLTSPGLKMKS